MTFCFHISMSSYCLALIASKLSFCGLTFTVRLGLHKFEAQFTSEKIMTFRYPGKVMPKMLLARLQQYVSQELPDVQDGFRKGRGTRDQITNICWILGKAKEFQKNIYFCFTEYTKSFDCVNHNKLENS